MLRSMEVHVYLVFVVAVLSCLGVTRGADGRWTLTGKFKETSTDPEYGLNNGFVSGEFYYLYDKNTPSRSRIRMEYNFSNAGMKVTNLYDYDGKALFSWLSTCTGTQFKYAPDPWWYDSGRYVPENSAAGHPKWYTSQIGGSYIKRILLPNTDGAAVGGRGVAQGVEFADGRSLTFEDVKFDYLDASDSRFGFGYGVKCPDATCPLFADIVFVLDNSASVSTAVWQRQIDFVETFTKQFELGSDKVVASMVQYNSDQGTDQEPYQAKESYCCVKGCFLWWCWCRAECDRYVTKYRTVPENCGNSQGVTTLVPSASSTFISNVRGYYYNRPGRCRSVAKQWRGLSVARSILASSNRYMDFNGQRKKSMQVVIAMAGSGDGDAASLRTQANLLKSNDVILVEVGFDSASSTLLSSVATVRMGRSLYFSGPDSSALKGLVEQIFEPICQLPTNTGQCGPACKGFCGGGKCLCPTCDINDQDTCKKFTCTENSAHTSATGCLEKDDPCPRTTNKCIKEVVCDGSQPRGDPRRCTEVPYSCNPGERELQACQVRNCDPRFGCLGVINNHTYCDFMYNKAGLCEVWKCSADGPLEKGGCYLEKNVTAECLKGFDPLTCIDVRCLPDSGMCSHANDRCSQHSDKCELMSCTNNPDDECQPTPNTEGMPSEAEQKCLKNVECDAADGWFYENLTAVDCIRKYVDEHPSEGFPSCMKFSCVSGVGCRPTAVPKCDPSKCDERFVENCISANVARTDAKCVQYSHCVVDENSQPQCVYESYDCTKVGGCTQGKCDVATGQCYTTPILNPYADIDTGNRCYESYCTANGNWAVRMRLDVEEAINKYKNSECFTYTCDNATGLVKHPLCFTSSECGTRECDDTEMKCIEHKGCETPDDAICTKRVCREGLCVDAPADPPEDVVAQYASEATKCTVFVCNMDDGTWSLDIKPESDEFLRDNKECMEGPCSMTFCDNETGDWVCIADSCTHSTNCTLEACDVNTGECYNRTNDCKDLDMEGYNCFWKDCLESRGGCTRRLYPNAYIDVCGNCVRDLTGEGSSVVVTSSEEMECMEGASAPILPAVLTAGVIAVIVIAAIVGTAILGVSGVLGTKTLIERARAAQGQGAHSNPLFEENDQEMSNPAYSGDR